MRPTQPASRYPLLRAVPHLIMNHSVGAQIDLNTSERGLSLPTYAAPTHRIIPTTQAEPNVGLICEQTLDQIESGGK